MSDMEEKLREAACFGDIDGVKVKKIKTQRDVQ